MQAKELQTASNLLANILAQTGWPSRIHLPGAVFKAHLCRVDSKYEDAPVSPEALTRLRGDILVELSHVTEDNQYLIAYILEYVTP